MVSDVGEMSTRNKFSRMEVIPEMSQLDSGSRTRIYWIFKRSIGSHFDQKIYNQIIMQEFLIRFQDESNFINEDEPCYRGVIRGGLFKLPKGNGLATVAFRLTVKICKK